MSDPIKRTIIKSNLGLSDEEVEILEEIIDEEDLIESETEEKIKSHDYLVIVTGLLSIMLFSHVNSVLILMLLVGLTILIYLFKNNKKLEKEVEGDGKE